jgi:short-subunit dehydrogenase
MSRYDNKLVAISGATGAIGREISMYFLAQHNSLLLLGRNDEKLNTLRDELKSIYPQSRITLIKADFLQLDKLQDLFRSKKVPPCDLLINNAGIRLKNSFYTNDGFEVHMQVNCLAPHFLTKEFAKLKPKFSVVNIGSSSALRLSAFNLDLCASRGNKKYAGNYALSKLALLVSTKSLNESDSQLNLIAVDPGNVRSSMTMGSDSPLALRLASTLFFKTPTNSFKGIVEFFNEEKISLHQGKFVGKNGEMDWASKFDYAKLKSQYSDLLMSTSNFGDAN